MLDTRETSQCVMCPYIASAATEFANHSCVAAFRAQVLLKVPGGAGGGAGGAEGKGGEDGGVGGWGGEGGEDGGQLWHESGHTSPQEL